MDPLEQLPPNKPNFKLIVVLFAISIVIVLVLATLFLKRDAKHLAPNGKAAPGSSMASPPALFPNPALVTRI